MPRFHPPGGPDAGTRSAAARRARSRGLAALAALAAPAALAVTLGPIEVRSRLGAPLDGRIPVAAAAGESLRGACFRLAPSAPGTPHLTDGALTLRRSAHGAYLRVHSQSAVHDPALILRVTVSCPGSTAQAQRDYAVLLDPAPGVAAPVRSARAAARPAASAPGTRLASEPGDTLASIAAAIFPRDRVARRTYLKALHAGNPALAALGDAEPIPRGSTVVLPDLRAFSRVAHASARSGRPKPQARAGAPASALAPAAPTARPAPQPVAAAVPPTAGTERPRPSRPPAAGAATDGFRLRLSAPVMDLAPSRRMDEHQREALRQRLLVLEADDQTAAMLEMRNQLRQLESQVAELRLKLAAMPAALAPAAPPSPAAAPAAIPAPPAPGPSVPNPDATTQPANTSAAERTAVPTSAAAAANARPRAVTNARPRAVANTEAGSRYPEWLWAALAAVAAVALAIVLLSLRRRRRREEDFGYELPLEEPSAAEADAAAAFEVAPATAPGAAPERHAVASDLELATRLPEESADELRRRYIEERFPEIVNRTIDLSEPDSVVKGARLFYQDGALPRAVELLQFAVEGDPAQTRYWLALFEIFRLERLSGEFAELAARFHRLHGDSREWPKVRSIGREIDPDNPLYRDAGFEALETIGPAQARRAADAAFDPVTDNWLDAPMDFENEVLANELRKSLLAEAALTEEDLAPDPMPALRSVEVFTVA